MVTFHIFVRGVYLESSLQVKQNTLDTNQKIGFLRIIAELTFIRQVNNREPSFMMIVFSPYYYFCFCYHISFTIYAVLLFLPSYQFAVRLTEKSYHFNACMYLITLHSRWVQEYTSAVKVRNISHAHHFYK